MSTSKMIIIVINGFLLHLVCVCVHVCMCVCVQASTFLGGGGGVCKTLTLDTPQ